MPGRRACLASVLGVLEAFVGVVNVKVVSCAVQYCVGPWVGFLLGGGTGYGHAAGGGQLPGRGTGFGYATRGWKTEGNTG